MQQEGRAKAVEPGSHAAEIAAERMERQAAELDQVAAALRRKKLDHEAEDLVGIAESMRSTAQVLNTGLVAPEPRLLRLVTGKGHQLPDDAVRDAIVGFGDEPFTKHDLRKVLKVSDQTAAKRLRIAVAKEWCVEAGFRQLGPGRPTQLYLYKRPEGGPKQRPTLGRDHHLAGLDPKKVTEHVQRGSAVEFGAQRAKSTHPEMERILQKAEEQGWTITLGGGGHYKCLSPEGKMVTCSRTPGTSGPLRMTRATFARAGLKL